MLFQNNIFFSWEIKNILNQDQIFVIKARVKEKEWKRRKKEKMNRLMGIGFENTFNIDFVLKFNGLRLSNIANSL